MPRIKKSFKSIADFQSFVDRFFPTYKGQMLSLGQTPCAVTVQSVFHRGYSVHINTASDAMCAVGSGTFSGMTSFQLFTAPAFAHGVLINPTELMFAQDIGYATVAHAAHKAYSLTIKTELLSDEAKEILAGGGNSIQLTSDQANEITQFFDAIADGQKEDKKTVAALLNKAMRKDQKRDINQHSAWEIGAELIRIAHSQTPEDKIKLPDLSRLMLSNKDKITKASHELMGVTPMVLLRNARLHQCRHLIQHGESVEQARRAFNFSNRKDFNERYKALFGELPTESRTDP